MADADRYQERRIHGAGVSSLPTGFDEIAMPAGRRPEALAIVREVLAANGVQAEDELRWYRTEGTPELCCYWADCHNLMWIRANNVHVLADTSALHQPERPITWADEQGICVGWLLPGASRGAGGGTPTPRAAEVLCPETFIRQPAGTVCGECDVVHG